MAQLQSSHISANAPARPEFQTLLSRDLTAYFAQRDGKAVTVKFELLRDGPTQVGTSYPKYFLWVWVSTGSTETTSGAVTVAAIDKVQFAVSGYVPRERILASPEILPATFPAALVSAIEARARAEGQ